MILQEIKKLKLKNIIDFGLKILVIIYGLILLVLTNLTFIYSFPIFGVVTTVMGIGFIIIVSMLSHKFLAQQKNINKDIETKVYGKRRLIIDSIEEFSTKDTQSEIVSDIDVELKFNPKVKKFFESAKNRFIKQVAVYSVVLLLSIIATIFIAPYANQKINNVSAYLNNPVDLDIPDYYIEGQVLQINLSNQLMNFDKIVLELTNQNLHSDNAVFTIEKSITAQKSFILKIAVYKYGLRRIVSTKELTSTKKLLPNRISLCVVYPFKREEYGGIQDLEMWQGGRIEIDGYFTKNLQSINIRPNIKAPYSITKNHFSLSFYPQDTKKYAMRFYANDSDLYNAPEFTIKVVPNQAPSIQLIFPTQNVMINHYLWSVYSIVESEDDQGLRKLYYWVIVTNRNPRLRYITKKSYEIWLNNKRYSKNAVRFTYAGIELLPGDVATISYRVVDVFGKYSRVVKFNITSPDFDELMRRRQKLQHRLRKSIEQLGKKYEGLKKDIRNQNLAGANQKTKDIESSVSNIEKTVSDLNKNYSTSEKDIQEMKESLEKMREITESLRKNSETIKEISKLLSKNKKIYKNIDLSKLDMKQSLEELSALLKNLEYYKKFTDLVAQMNILEKTYDSLKNQKTQKGFERNLKSYQEQLKKLGKMGDDKIKKMIKQLQQESKNLRQSKSDSFKKSDNIMQNLRDQVQQKLSQASQNRMKKRIDQVGKIIDELYLNEIILHETIAIDKGSRDNYNITNFNRTVENVNAVNTSIKKVRADIHTALEGLTFEGDTRKDLVALLKKNQEIIQYTIISLRDNQTYQINSGLNFSANYIALITLYMIKVQSALNKAMKQQQGKGQGKSMSMSMSISMSDLMKMQASMSMGLQQMLQQMQKSGRMTPGMKELFDEMAKLQREIRKNLQNMMEQNKSGAISGGDEMNKMMGDIIKDLESYNIKTDTLEKSKKLEKKLLKSKKSIKSKGISKKRKADSAKYYEVKPPADNKDDSTEKIDLNEIKSREMSDYYRNLIEKYKQHR